MRTYYPLVNIVRYRADGSPMVGVCRDDRITPLPFGSLAELWALPSDRLRSALWDVFDFRPAAIIAALDLRRPMYRETAAYGHFGRKEFPWEATDRADELRRALG